MAGEMKATKKQRILDLMMPADGKLPGPWVINGRLNEVCFAAYSQRMGDLKDLGYDFEKRWSAEDHTWYYRMTALPPETVSLGMKPPCQTAPAADATRPPESKPPSTTLGGHGPTCKNPPASHNEQLTMEGIL